MAITIKSVPTLKGDAAGKFVEKAIKASEERATIDFSKQVKNCVAILKKAKL